MRKGEPKKPSDKPEALSPTVWPLEGFFREPFSEDVCHEGRGLKKRVSTLGLKMFFRPSSIRKTCSEMSTFL